MAARSIVPVEDSNGQVMRQSYRMQALEIIRAQIVSGQLATGTLHSIGAVASQLNVSVTPVREALHGLAADGLIEMRRNRGFVVREPTARELDDIADLREILEVAVVRRITMHTMLGHVAELRTLCAQNKTAAEDGDWVKFLNTDRQFHLSLLAAAGNQRLVELVGTLRDQSRLSGLDNALGSEEFRRSVCEHEDLLEAVVSGDADRAADVMITHLRHVRGLWAGFAEEQKRGTT